MQDLWRFGPTHVDFNVTNGCNLTCSHCHSSSGDKLPGELSTSEVCDILDQLHTLGVLRLSIAGGEPFLRPDILEILEYASSLQGWQVAVITNGMFFHDAGRVEDLARRCPGLTVNVSLDGSTPARFHILRRQARNPGNDPSPMFNRIVAGIRRLVDAGITTAVNMTLSRPTLLDCTPTYKLVVEELGASALVAIKFFPAGYGKLAQDMLDLPYDLWSPAFADLTRAKLAGDLSKLQISVPAAWEFYLPLIQAGIDVHAAERSWRYRAPLRESAYGRQYSIGDTSGIAEMSIAADGSVYPSVLFVGMADAVAGTTRTQSLAEIWSSSPLFSTIRAQRTEFLSANCGMCSLATVCGGGSRARAFGSVGTLNAVDQACPLSVEQPGRIPVPAQAPPATETSREPVRVLGTGSRAVRLLFTEDACQLRTNGKIISCDPEQAKILRALTASPPPGGQHDPVAGTLPGQTSVSSLSRLLDTLRNVDAAPDAVAPLARLRDVIVANGPAA